MRQKKCPARIIESIQATNKVLCIQKESRITKISKAQPNGLDRAQHLGRQDSLVIIPLYQANAKYISIPTRVTIVDFTSEQKTH